MSNLSVKFVSKKISKVKWRHQSASVFVTGSWDDKNNNLCVWSLPSLPSTPKDSSFAAEATDPEVVAQTEFPGGVTDLQITVNDLIFASSSNGSIHMYKYENEKIEHRHTWDRVHSFPKAPAPVTGIAVKANDVASAGEDGRLFVFDFNRFTTVKQIKGSDQCVLTAISFLRHHEIVCGNDLGYLKTWDLRSASDQPSRTLMISGDRVGVMGMSSHPTQPHVLATGHKSGSLCIWDLRQERRPVTLLASHDEAVTDILFHPTNPDYLFTSFVDGSIWQWDATSLKTSAMHTAEIDENVLCGNPWLNCDASKHRLDILSLFPHNTVCVNSLDLNDSTLLWGTDNEAIYILSGLNV